MSIARNIEPSIIVGADTLAPIHLETRTAEQLVELWHETEEALSCRGQMKPERGWSAESMQGIDSRVYWFVEYAFGAFVKSKDGYADMPIRAIARHWIDESGGRLVLSQSVAEEIALDKMLRWFGMNREAFANRIMAKFLNFLDLKKQEKGTL
jgi:hypothetical protein